MVTILYSQNEEFITLADPSLSLLTGEEEGEMDSIEEIPQHKVTDYRSVTIPGSVTRWKFNILAV